MTMYYAGIGSRTTPDQFMDVFTQVAETLEGIGFILRSGGAEGADTAFARGTNKREIYIPWWGFNQIRDKSDKTIKTMDDIDPATLYQSRKIFEQYHPNPKACTAVAQLLHMRNGFQVLGSDLETPAKFILCWTHNGSGDGGTGQAIRIAKAKNILVFDLGKPDWQQELANLETLIGSITA